LRRHLLQLQFTINLDVTLDKNVKIYITEQIEMLLRWKSEDPVTVGLPQHHTESSVVFLFILAGVHQIFLSYCCLLSVLPQ